MYILREGNTQKHSMQLFIEKLFEIKTKQNQTPLHLDEAETQKNTEKWSNVKTNFKWLVHSWKEQHYPTLQFKNDFCIYNIKFYCVSFHCNSAHSNCHMIYFNLK